jgi:hypothetical protein
MNASNNKKILFRYFLFFYVAELFFVMVSIISYLKNGFLPLPFWDDAKDTFMDFFHVNYWALHSERYSEWGSIYPPLSFVIGKLVTPANCHDVLNGFELRDCSLPSILMLIVIYVFGVFVFVRAVLKYFCINSEQKEPLLIFCISTAIILSFPSLFAIERGNYILICFVFLSLALVNKNPWVSGSFISFAILLKPYLAPLLAAPLLKKRYKYVAGIAIFSVIANLFTAYLLGDPNAFLFIKNILVTKGIGISSLYEAVTSTTSVASWLKLIKNPGIIRHIGDTSTVYLSLAFYVIATLYIAVIGYILYFTKKNRDAMSEVELSLIFILLVMVTFDGVGSYGLLLILPYLIYYLLKKSGNISSFKSRMYFFLIAMLYLPADIGLGPSRAISGVSYLSGAIYSEGSQISLSGLVRPILLIAFTALILSDFYKYNKWKKDY